MQSCHARPCNRMFECRFSFSFLLLCRKSAACPSFWDFTFSHGTHQACLSNLIFYTVCCPMVVVTFSQQIRAQRCCSWIISVYMHIKMQVHKFQNREHIECSTNRWIEHWPENMFGILLRTGMVVSQHFLLFTRCGSAYWLVFLSLRPITLHDEVMNSIKYQWKEAQGQNQLSGQLRHGVCVHVGISSGISTGT